MLTFLQRSSLLSMSEERIKDDCLVEKILMQLPVDTWLAEGNLKR